MFGRRRFWSNRVRFGSFRQDSLVTVFQMDAVDFFIQENGELGHTVLLDGGIQIRIDLLQFTLELADIHCICMTAVENFNDLLFHVLNGGSVQGYPDGLVAGCNRQRFEILEIGRKFTVVIITDIKIRIDLDQTAADFAKTGFLTDGTVFDSSVARGTPIAFPIGAGRVIAGWDEGIAMLSSGSKAKLIIPYFLAYGEQGRPPVIPAKATLIFDVELVSVK